jgi:RHS repeat-associated protein
MKRLVLLYVIILGSFFAHAQNPFTEYGYTPKIATLSHGQFNEFFDNDTIVQIGSVLFNTKSKQIVTFVETDTLYSEATLEPDIASRWISPDPLADNPNQIDQSPYQYAWNNPIALTDPDGKCPICPWLDAIVDVGFVVYDVGVLVNEKIVTGSTTGANWAALGADGASILVPMSVGAGVAARAAFKGVDKAMDAVKVVDKVTDASKGITKTEKGSEKARFIVDKKGTAVDTKTTPRGSYNQPDGGRTDVLQDKTHYNKSTGKNVGQSHTHEPYSNTNTKTGETRTGADRNKAHKPSYEEVKNIETGTATPVK